MPLTPEQAKIIKEQLLKQIQRLPEEQKKEAETYLKSLTETQLEEFLKQNEVSVSTAENKEQEKNSKTSSCIYCNIAQKKVGSFILFEDNECLVVLEINPVSEGHSLLIPKMHISESKNTKASFFAKSKKIATFISKKLKADNFQITTSDELGHAIINIIPTYKDEKKPYGRKKAEENELRELAIKIGKYETKEKKPKLKKENTAPQDKSATKPKSGIMQMNRRIP
jgi:histidine triad (HIT) family protein